MPAQTRVVPKPSATLPDQDQVLLAFGAGVRRLREAKELTQEDLAHEAGVHVTYISQIERGLRNVSLYNIYRVAWALGVTPAELMTAATASRPRRST